MSAIKYKRNVNSSKVSIHIQESSMIISCYKIIRFYSIRVQLIKSIVTFISHTKVINHSFSSSWRCLWSMVCDLRVKLEFCRHARKMESTKHNEGRKAAKGFNSIYNKEQQEWFILLRVCLCDSLQWNMVLIWSSLVVRSPVIIRAGYLARMFDN